MIFYLEAGLIQGAAAKVNPGRPVTRRLRRAGAILQQVGAGASGTTEAPKDRRAEVEAWPVMACTNSSARPEFPGRFVGTRSGCSSMD